MSTSFRYAYHASDSNWPVPAPDKHNANTNGESKRTAQAVVLGLGSMFNHSTMFQNVGWTRDTKHLIITYRALRDIQAGEELCISYGSRLTFVDADNQCLDDEGDGTQMLCSIELV
ncbi:hypothetical protein ANO11243_053140 [Dothideomycetidae sp. 11243]|nr:hypothetical protein ANO11243_053140 [fungal sp. No.11243]